MEVYVFLFITVEFAAGRQGHGKIEKLYKNWQYIKPNSLPLE